MGVTPKTRGGSASIPSPAHCSPGRPSFLPRTVKVSGWPEPDRTGHRLGRGKRKRRGTVAPPPAQQARLRGHERERRRRMPYV